MRMRADVRYARGDSEEYWYEVPESRADKLSVTGNPWLACLLPLAATLGEPLSISLPVDKALKANAARLMSIWRAWYPDLFEVPVQAEVETSPQARGQGRVGAFFSGGVDSFFTLLRDRATAVPAERRPIQDLITVCGFDIAVERSGAFGSLLDRHRDIADRLGHELIDVTTNLRRTRWAEARWGYLAHGAGLASIALAFEQRFDAVYIAGSGGYRKFLPWGSHLVTDPLFSTGNTAIVNDAAAYLRTEKIGILASSQLALEFLRVCYESPNEDNCGRCSKCVRTMVALDLFGALSDCKTLPHPSDLIDRVARIDCSSFADFRELEDLRRVAESMKRLDVVIALDRSIWRTRLRQAVRTSRRAIDGPAGRIASLLDRIKR
ncbi:MAG: hypothetical protein ABIR58_07460 [Gemmatimonadaceae bacterium]